MIEVNTTTVSTCTVIAVTDPITGQLIGTVHVERVRDRSGQLGPVQCTVYAQSLYGLRKAGNVRGRAEAIGVLQQISQRVRVTAALQREPMEA